jgi:oxygen-independent coproporphyrinogen-3 oxidase
MFTRLYVHVPFCVNKCRYCAFVSGVPQEKELTEYPELLLRELQLHRGEQQPLASIYFGGGTPSLLQPRHVSKLLEAISAQSGIAEGAEITLEVNPGTVDIHSLKAFRAAGVNRVSLGLQSFDDHYLRLLGRIHTAEQSRRTFSDAREAGFNNVSIDLMHSLPAQSLEQWRTELQHAVTLRPEHTSIYGLTVEEGTPFAQMYPHGCQDLGDEDLAAQMFELADELLAASGYEHYEIASYARPDCRSRHNSGYWRRDGYLGLGVAAHSLLRNGHGVRFSNPETLDEYRRMVMSGQLARHDEQILTQQDAMAEYMFLGLRMADGVGRAEFVREFGRSLESVYGPAVAELVSFGLLVENNGTLSVTRRGMLLSNQVFNRFL